MSTSLGVQNDVIRRGHAGGHGLHDHSVRAAEMRRRQAEAITNGVRWIWTHAGRALRLLNRTRAQTPVVDDNQIARSLGRASLADALRRDLLRLARLVRFIREPYARRRRRRIAIAQLRSLGDHLLADIGLTRGQIELAVDGMLSRREGLSRPVGRAVPAAPTPDELPLAA
jgi:uncharacterized protein YjiS (DUF1127 family)